MRKIVSILLVAMMLLTLFGCGNKPKTYGEQCELGLELLANSEYEEAIAAFTAAIEIDSENYSAYVGRGDAYVGAELFEPAFDDYTHAMKLSPKQKAIFEKLSAAYVSAGNDEKAADILQLYELTLGNEDEKAVPFAVVEGKTVQEDEYGYAKLDLILPRVISISEDALSLNEQINADFERFIVGGLDLLAEYDIYPMMQARYKVINTDALYMIVVERTYGSAYGSGASVSVFSYYYDALNDKVLSPEEYYNARGYTIDNIRDLCTASLINSGIADDSIIDSINTSGFEELTSQFYMDENDQIVEYFISF